LLFATKSKEDLYLGAGLKYTIPEAGTLVIDYAYEDFGVLNDVQLFTLGLDF